MEVPPAAAAATAVTTPGTPVPFVAVDLPPLPNALSASDWSTLGTQGSSSASQRSRYLTEFFTGKKLDKRLLVYCVAILFTAVVMAFSLVMIVLRPEQTQVWLPVVTFTLGVWISELRQLHQPSSTSTTSTAPSAASTTSSAV